MCNDNEHCSFQVELQLPRFKVESSFQLKGMLSDLGMPLAFSDKADFSGMVSGPAADLLYISEVFHKVRFFSLPSVDEFILVWNVCFSYGCIC